MKRFFLVPLFFLAACQTGVKTDSAPTAAAVSQTAPSPEDPCSARTFENLVGTPGDQVRDSMFPAGSRVLRPGMVMTMDYRSERLNVVIGEEGTVERVYCG